MMNVPITSEEDLPSRAPGCPHPEPRLGQAVRGVAVGSGITSMRGMDDANSFEMLDLDLYLDLDDALNHSYFISPVSLP